MRKYILTLFCIFVLSMGTASAVTFDLECGNLYMDYEPFQVWLTTTPHTEGIAHVYVDGEYVCMWNSDDSPLNLGPLPAGMHVIQARFYLAGAPNKYILSPLRAVRIAKEGSEGVTGAEIPEFPTVSLPLATIMGLIFLFGRKKG